jgi:hypothetical protein
MKHAKRLHIVQVQTNKCRKKKVIRNVETKEAEEKTKAACHRKSNSITVVSQFSRPEEFKGHIILWQIKRCAFSALAAYIQASVTACQRP